MSLQLFILYINGTVREASKTLHGIGLDLNEDGGRWELCQLLFANNIALVADIRAKLCCLITEFGRVCDWRKLRVNVRKSKVVKCREKDPSGRMEIELNNKILEEVVKLKYFRMTIAANGGAKANVRHSVNEKCKLLSEMKQIVKNGGMGMKVKRESMKVKNDCSCSDVWRPMVYETYRESEDECA